MQFCTQNVQLKLYWFWLTHITYTIPGWRRGLVVRMSVFGSQKFHDLRLIHSWHVTTSWVECPPWVNQPGQLSFPYLRGRNTSSIGLIRVITWITGWRPLNGRPGLCMAVQSQVKVLWPNAWPTAHRLYARSVCDTTAPLQLQLLLVALYKWYDFTLTLCLHLLVHLSHAGYLPRFASHRTAYIGFVKLNCWFCVNASMIFSSKCSTVGV